MKLPKGNLRGNTNLIVGFFVFSTIIIIITTFSVIFTTHGVFNPKYELYAIFPDGIGLRKGTSVLYNGVQVGSVENIDLFRNSDSRFVNHVQTSTSVILKLTLDDKFKSFITDKSVAFVMRDKNLVSDRVINIESPESSNNILKNKDTLSVTLSRDIETVLTSLSSLMEKVDALVLRADNILVKVTDPGTTVGSMIGSRELYDTIMVDLARVNEALVLGKSVLNKAGKLEDNVTEIVPGILSNADSTFKNIVGTTENLDALVNRLNGISLDVTQLMEKVNGLIDEGKGELDNASQLIEAVSKFWFIRGKIKKENTQEFPLLLEELEP